MVTTTLKMTYDVSVLIETSSHPKFTVHDVRNEIHRCNRVRSWCAAIAVGALLLAIVTGCATGTLTSHDEDMDAKRFVAPSDRARIYIVRPGQLKAAGLIEVSLDGVPQAELPIKSYVVVDVAPGHHKIAFTLKGEALPLEAEAGHIYFYRVTNTMHLQKDSDADGRHAVMWSNRAENIAQ